MNSHEVKYGEFNRAIVVGVNKMDRFKITVFVYFANYTTPSCIWTCVRGSDLTTSHTFFAYGKHIIWWMGARVISCGVVGCSAEVLGKTQHFLQRTLF